MLHVNVGVCSVFYGTSIVGVSVVYQCGCMYCMVLYSICVCIICNVHHVYVYIIEEKEMGACSVWEPI